MSGNSAADAAHGDGAAAQLLRSIVDTAFDGPAGDHSHAGATVRSGGAVDLHDLHPEPRFNGTRLLHEHRVVSGLSVPIGGGARPYGVLAAYSQHRRRYTREDTTFLEAAAGIVAGAIERHRLQEGLLREQAFLDRMVGTLPGLVCMVDASGRCIRWSKEVEQISGYDAPEIARMTPLDFLPVEERDAMAAAMQTTFAVGQNSIDVHLVTKKGDRIPLHLTGVRLYREAGPCVMGIAIDVSDRRRLEEQLRQSQKMEAFGQLAGGVAHDFNNLLTIVFGYCEILLANLRPPDPALECVTAINDAAERAAELTRQLLAFSRRTVLEPKIVDLNAVVGSTENMLRRVIGEDIRLTTVRDRQLRPVKLDPNQLTQVLINLSVNARDAMPMGGTLTMETRNIDLDQKYADTHPDVKPGPYVMLAVSDTGCGMPADVRARIFEPFFTTKGVGKGTGLGMAVVHGIVKQSGGHIEVYSEPGLGTAFKLYFPAVDAALTPCQGPALAGAPHGSETLLLVEDEYDLRELARLVLEAHGYRVLTAGHARDALELAGSHQGSIALLVTDVVMPDMDGRALAEALRRRVPHLKILFMSGYTDHTVMHHGILHEQAAFLQKPFSPHALARKVRELLDQSA